MGSGCRGPGACTLCWRRLLSPTPAWVGGVPAQDPPLLPDPTSFLWALADGGAAWTPERPGGEAAGPRTLSSGDTQRPLLDAGEAAGSRSRPQQVTLRPFRPKDAFQYHMNVIVGQAADSLRGLRIESLCCVPKPHTPLVNGSYVKMKEK